MPVALAAALMTTSNQKNPPAATSLTTFTRVLPEKDFVFYIVQDHDTLKSVATLYFGDQAYWTTLWNDNPEIKDPENLPPGISLKVRDPKPETPAKLISELQSRLPTPQPIVQSARVAAPPPVEAPQTSYEDVYKAAGSQYGIPWQILYGIHMTETGGRNGHIVSHLGNGPEGPMQFMPGTFAAYSVDGDGDGKADIDNAVDAIYAAANYLAKHGSLEAGLRSYGGNTPGTLAYARAKGYQN